jgi:hypothetical protein
MAVWGEPIARAQASGASVVSEDTKTPRSTMRGGVNVSNNNAGAAAGGGALYGLGMFGAWVFFWQQADTFWGHLLTVVQGIVWPAFMVDKGFSALGK